MEIRNGLTGAKKDSLITFRSSARQIGTCNELSDGLYRIVLAIRGYSINLSAVFFREYLTNFVIITIRRITHDIKFCN